MKLKKMHIFNTYKFFLLVLIGSLAAVSCHDELLHSEPESDLTTQGFYNNASDIDAAVLGIYSSLQSRWPRDFVLKEVPSDNAYGYYYANTDGLEQIELLDIAADNDEVNKFWKNTYQGIYRANIALDNIDNPDNYSGNLKEQYEGEARFLRAFLYFDLVRMFGGVPLLTDSQLNMEDAREVPRSSEQEIYNAVISDLTEALALLPGPSEMIHGRVSRAAAAALLGKVYVYLENYAEARPHLESVLNDYNFDLVDNYGDLFNIETEQNSETIFSLAYTRNNSHNLNYNFNPHGGVLGYSTLGIREVRPTWDLHQQFDEEDSRYGESIREEFIPAAGSPDDNPEWYPFFSKYMAPDLGSQTSPMDIPVLRLADVVLLYSEVLFEVEGPAEALVPLNRVRERAFGDASHNYTVSEIGTRENFRDILLHERRLEFVLENERWFDIVRMGKLEEILGGELESEYNPSTGRSEIQQINAEGYMKYFPIPNEQINLSSSGVLEQNPGY